MPLTTPDDPRYATEKRLAMIRLAVVAANTLLYAAMDGPTSGWLAYPLLVGSWLYAAWMHVFQPYRRLPYATTVKVQSVVDVAFVIVWLYATGGVTSPFAMLLPLAMLVVAFRHTQRGIAIAATAYALGFVGLGAATGQLWTDPHAVAVGVVYTLAFAMVGGAMAREVVAQKLARETARADEVTRRLAAIVESSDDAIFAIDLEGRIESWNGGAVSLYGYLPDEAIGQPFSLIVPESRGDEPAMFLERVRRGIGIVDFETERVGKDWRALWVSISASPIRDRDGRIVGAAIVHRDITEHRELRQRLLLADRMASLGTLAGGVAHEINNPMSFVVANLDLVAERLPELPAGVREELTEIIADARHGADRVRRIVQDLKAFSRDGGERRGVVDLRRVVELSVNMTRNEIRHRARLTVEHGDVPHVEGDESRLGQVLVNLMVNAAQAIPEGTSDEHEIRVVTRVDRGDVCVEVHDTGRGMTPEVKARIFEPFFTTKPVGQGTGLGLSICHGIVRGLGGDIEVDSEVGKGSVFRVRLRAVGDEDATHEIRLDRPVFGQLISGAG